MGVRAYLKSFMLIEILVDFFYAVRFTLQDECQCNWSYIWYKRRRLLILLPFLFILVFWYATKSKEFEMYTSFELPWRWKLSNLEEKWQRVEHTISSEHNVFSAFLNQSQDPPTTTVLGSMCTGLGIERKPLYCQYWYTKHDQAPARATNITKVVIDKGTSRSVL